MPEPKRKRGRPVERKYPPRIDATAEEIAEAMFAFPDAHKRKYEEEAPTEYRCADCEREVNYPETLYRDGRCDQCHFLYPS